MFSGMSRLVRYGIRPFSSKQESTSFVLNASGSSTKLIYCRQASMCTNKHGKEEGPVTQHIREKLQKAFQPEKLEVICESHMHAVPRGSEKHFSVVIVSDKFKNLSPLERQRLVYGELKEELKNGPVHALSIHATVSSKDSLNVPKSPPCMGGKKS